MPKTETRNNREKETIRQMIGIYCRGQQHAPGKVCGECTHLLLYAIKCINNCPYGEQDKPVCGLCPTHCFTPAMKKRMHEVMRRAGPRMLLLHPVLTVLHFFDVLKRRRPPESRKSS